MNQTRADAPLRLSWTEKDRTLLIIPEDNDRFCVTVEEAINACRVYDTKERARMQTRLRQLVKLLWEWAHEHSEDIDRAFLTVRDRGLLFLVVMKGRKHNEELEECLTDLDVQVANDPEFQSIFLSVLAIPKCGPDGYLSFIDPQLSLEYRDKDAK